MSTSIPAQSDNPDNNVQATQIVLKKSTVIWVLAAFVVLSFLAALLGGFIAAGQRPDAPPLAAPTSTPEPSATVDPEFEDLIDEILPAGADVRAGTGAPDSGYGSVGDVYINLSNSDVYARRDDGWQRVGNIRADSAENLVGAQGEQGVPGSPGDRGEAGQDGTQVVLRGEAPDPGEACEPDGSILIDTSVFGYYYHCAGGVWQVFSPPIE